MYNVFMSLVFITLAVQIPVGIVTVHMLVEGNYADVQGGVVSRANRTGKHFWVVVWGLKQEKLLPRTFSQIIVN